MTSPPTSVVDIAGRLRRATARLGRQLRLQAGTGLSASLHSALASIESHGPLTLGQLAAREHVAPPTITRVVSRLEEAGLVHRDIDPTDRRVSRVSITAEGRDRLERSRVQRNAMLADRLSLLTPDQIERLAGALDVLELLVDAGSTASATTTSDGTIVADAQAGAARPERRP